jgi:hypothetical protein
MGRRCEFIDARRSSRLKWGGGRGDKRNTQMNNLLRGLHFERERRRASIATAHANVPS